MSEQNAEPDVSGRSDFASGSVPEVSVVVPMLNEIDYIDECLDGLSAQDYPLDRLDVIVVDGGSTDGSRERVLERAGSEPWLRLVENPAGKASAAFNVGTTAARGEVVCLFSSHGVPARDFVRRSVEVLEESGAAGVGGRYLHVGLTKSANSIGLAMTSPFGMASPHRFADERREVDTISHPAYRIDRLRSVGPFDESLERNSDYELNFRLREAGEDLVFDPGIESIYRPRASLSRLARQFWHYGRWKERVVRRHPGSLRARHLVPPVVVAVLVVSPLLLMTSAGRRALLVGGSAYGALVALAAVAARPGKHQASFPVLLACFPTMHVSWGAGFLVSCVEDQLDHRGGSS